MKKTLLGLFALSTLLISCSGEEKKTNSEPEEKKELNCYYSYDATSTEMTWTAFKFIRKAPVGGTFNTINVEGPEKSADLKSLIGKLSFTIPVASVNTKNPDRDKKIDSIFFGSLENTARITGKLVGMDDNGNASLSITMNAVTKEVEGSYTLNDETFVFNTTIDVNDWNAQNGITALNTACEDLHTDVENGDTESKLWSEVDITFSTVFKKDCE